MKINFYNFNQKEKKKVTELLLELRLALSSALLIFIKNDRDFHVLEDLKMKIKTSNVYYFILKDPGLIMKALRNKIGPLFFFDELESEFLKTIVRGEKFSFTNTTELIHLDEVTGLFNQRKLNLDLDYFTQKKISFSVLFIDIDHFKQVNDSFGHIFGGEALVQLADELKKQIRESDYIYRYGGDEFVVILPQTSQLHAEKVAGRIVNCLKSKIFYLKFKQKHYQLKLSVSIGLATYPIHANCKEEILHLADLMLYKAKTNGRGQFCLFAQEGST